ncbi:MAG TPA: Cj0069 family protein [Fimbriimonadaceae bacterium]|nr:Cj0069 family protein [Fimbriimonadaceae bacterium]
MAKRVALVWHGNREARDSADLGDHRLGPTAQALKDADLAPEPCVYNDDFADEALGQLKQCDAALVWVNPIEDGRDRTRLDSVLSEAAIHGTLVSAHPDAIRKMGTKDVLFQTRSMGWGSDVRLYPTFESFCREFPKALAEGRARVVKQWRGQSGNGVWKVTPIADGSVLARHAKRGEVEEEVPLEAFLNSCRPYFAGEGHVIDQEYNLRIDEGTVRCYFVQDRVQGFGHQEVNALVDSEPAPGQRIYFPPDDPRWQPLRARLEEEWLGEMRTLLGVSPDELPMLWDADFMFGPPPREWTLCEINVSSVYPYPESAMAPLAHALAARLG